VDIHPAIASLLKAFVGERKSGFLFASRNGKPLSSSNIIRRHLHPALKELNYVNPHTGTHKAGNHAFRRFRNTYLKNYTDCPKGLYDYWLGHAGKDMSDLYDKIREDVPFRKMWAEKSGLVGERGFEPPTPWSRTRCSTRLSHSPTAQTKKRTQTRKKRSCARTP
jgi:integrase